MRNENWLVGAGIRPAGPPDRCFYCDAAKGAEHQAGCVCRRRTVVVRAIVEYVVAVPEDSMADDIEFHRNESSWCGSNGFDEIGTICDAENSRCLCSFIRYEYVREATAEDEASPVCLQTAAQLAAEEAIAPNRTAAGVTGEP